MNKIYSLAVRVFCKRNPIRVGSSRLTISKESDSSSRSSRIRQSSEVELWPRKEVLRAFHSYIDRSKLLRCYLAKEAIP